MFKKIKKIRKYCSGYLNFLLGRPAIQIDKKLKMDEVLRVVKSGSIWEKYQLLPSFMVGKRRLTRFQSLLLLGSFCFAGIILSCYFDNALPFLFLLGIAIAVDTAVTFDTTATKFISIASMSSTHFVIAFEDDGDSDKGKVIAGYITGTTITIVEDGATVFDTSAVQYCSIASMSSTHFIIAFQDDGDSDKGKVIAGSLSGVTITIVEDGATVFETGITSSTSIASMSSTHFVIAFIDDTDAEKGKVIAGSLSGTTITIVEDDATVFETSVLQYCSIVSMSSTHFVIAFIDIDDFSKGKIIAGYITGTTITIVEDGATVFATGTVTNLSIAAMSSTHFVIAFIDFDDFSKGKVIAGFITGTTITIVEDGATVFETGASVYVAIISISSIRFLIAFRDIPDDNKGKVIDGYISGTTIKIVEDGATVFETSVMAYTAIVAMSSTHFVIAFQDDGASDEGKVIAGNLIPDYDAVYPDALYDPREKENKSGVTYTPANKTVGYADDVFRLDGEVKAIQEELGLNPRGVYQTVKAWLSALATTFLGLSDTPASYSGEVGKIPRVNAGEDALEFLAAFLGLADTPASYSGGSLKSVRVNVGETALEFAAPAKLDYTEKMVNFNALGDNAWEEYDLSGDGVPANAVCEIAIGNDKANAEYNGGVRATDSALNRYLPIQEAEGGGLDLVTMHVKADANSKIDIFAQETAEMTFYLLGYWT